MKTVVIVPAWNEEKTIGGVLDSLISNVDEVIVVNDGSTDRTSEIAFGRGARVVTHVLNRGLGASLATGIIAALNNGADIIVTFDADGQHLIEDLKKVIAPIQSGDVDVVIGSRMLNASGMPFIRRVANRVGNEVTAILFGARVTDSQSGFRAFSRHAASKIQIKTDRMEVSSEIVAEIFRHNLSLLEVPIRAHYTEYSLSKGQGFLTGLRTLGRLIFRRTFR